MLPSTTSRRTPEHPTRGLVSERFKQGNQFAESIVFLSALCSLFSFDEGSQFRRYILFDVSALCNTVTTAKSESNQVTAAAKLEGCFSKALLMKVIK